MHQWVDSQQGIIDLLLSSFKDIFYLPNSANRSLDLSFITPVISESTSSSLLAPFSNEDIKAAFFDMNPHKAPGGFGPKFYQAYWPMVGQEICKAIQGFFHHG